MSQRLIDVTVPHTAGVKLGDLSDNYADFLPGILFTYEVAGRKVACRNNRIGDCLGFTVAEFEALGLGLHGLVYAEDLPILEHALNQFVNLQQGSSLDFIARFNHQSGGYRYLRCHCSRISETTVLLFASDVSNDVRIQEDFKATRQLFDESEQLLLFGTWSWSPLSNKLEWTDGMYHLLGYEPAEVSEPSMQFYFSHVYPETAAQLELLLKNAVEAGSDFEFEHILRTNKGEDKYVHIKAKCLGENDRISKVVGITRDITAKKNLEKERERNIRELNKSNKELEEFAYVASHDLHEPLRKILTFNERLRTRFSEALGADGTSFLERISASAGNMRHLIDNLLEFSRISRGARAFEKCDLNTVIRDVISDQELRIEETSTVMNLKDLPIVEGVPSELRQLFNNLIGNAIKFRRRDVSPVISIHSKELTHKEKSELLLPFNEVFYQVSVIDNGIGFESVYAEKIFEIFQRLHGKAEYGGSGIGLAICKKIVENHDGIIFASSEPGAGATFSVILPDKQFK